MLDKNVFVERVLPGSVIRTLTDAEMDEYRRPFAEPGEGRRPTLTWPRQIPIDGEPADVVAIVAGYAEWLATSDVPKLFVVAEPGAILNGAPAASSAAPGRTRPRSRWPAITSSRRTARTRSARRSPSGSVETNSDVTTGASAETVRSWCGHDRTRPAVLQPARRPAGATITT